VLVESEVVHAGKRLCSLKGVMKRESDGAVMATCEHGKGTFTLFIYLFSRVCVVAAMERRRDLLIEWVLVSIDPEVPKL
jgi:hypothetical protein